MRSSLSIWLTIIIIATIVAFMTVFKPVTFSARKDPSDPSQYLRPINTVDFSPTKAPMPFSSFGKVNVYLYPPQHDLRLGLDLRGGMRVVLQIPDRAIFTYSLNPPLEGTVAVQEKRDALNQELQSAQVLGDDAKDPSKVQLSVSNNEVEIVTRPLTDAAAQDQLKLIDGAMTKVFGEGKFVSPDSTKVFKTVDRELQNTVTSIMERRVNQLGLTEAVGYAKGTNQVVLEIPGVKDTEQVRRMIHETAQLEFRLVPDGYIVSTDDETGVSSVTMPNGKTVIDKEAINFLPREMGGDSLKPNSNVTYDQQHRPAVSFSMKTQADRDKFGALTSQNIGKQLAIVLDGKIITAPKIQDKITDDGIISGSFTMEKAKELSILLNAGALPVPVDIVENRTVSATLGADSVSMSMKAGIIGLLAVLLFMGIYYRLPGLMANLALIIYIFFSLAVLWFFQATLTLPGIAGIIISIGMAVDANVIIFERLKEELRTKKALETAIDVAFQRAWTAILDSNVASLITGSVLYALGTGAVKGFAITLMIGVAVSLVTAVTVTRLFMKLMIRSKAAHNLAWYGV